MKKCCSCKLDKSLDEYYQRKITPKTAKSGLTARCKVCLRAEASEHAKTKKYNLKPGDYEKMVVNQGGLCGICKSDDPSGGNPRVKRFAIDHDHLTNIKRGLLCNRCNRALGMFQDNVELLKKAIVWLEKDFGVTRTLF